MARTALLICFAFLARQIQNPNLERGTYQFICFLERDSDSRKLHSITYIFTKKGLQNLRS